MPETEPDSLAKRDPTLPVHVNRVLTDDSLFDKNRLPFTVVYLTEQNQKASVVVGHVRGPSIAAVMQLIAIDGSNKGYKPSVVAVFEGHHKNLL